MIGRGVYDRQLLGIDVIRTPVIKIQSRFCHGRVWQQRGYEYMVGGAYNNNNNNNNLQFL